MSQRKPHSIVKVDETESNEINRNFDVLYRGRPESLFFQNTSAIFQAFGYQDFIHGQISVSPTAVNNTSVTVNVALDKRYARTVFVTAHAVANGINATVSDVTGSSLSIIASPRNNSATVFSAVTSACVSIYWQFVGSLE